MIEPKMMSVERRKKLKLILESYFFKRNLSTWFHEAMADAEYWRKAVREADVCSEIGVPCPWCEVRTYDSLREAVHKPDCEYLVAQNK